MQTFHPKISVKLVKAVKRGEVVPGRNASGRYAGLDAIELTDFLGENGTITVSKSVREPAGGFSFVLRDQRHPKYLDTIAALIEPMDLVEIRMCRDPSSYKAGDWPPIVMRGLVSEVLRTETMQGGKPQRTVTINGQDFGKILQILMIYYLNHSAVGDNILSEFAFFHKYASTGSAKIKSANEFAVETVEQVINPYLKRLTALANGAALGAKVINEWSVEASVLGSVSPWAVSSFNNVSIYQMLTSLLDVGPFNELFVEDTADGVKLVLRPHPFLDAAGKPVQGKAAEVVAITDDDIVTMSLSRSDAGVANYYWVSNSRWTLMSNEDAQLAAMTGNTESFVLFEYLNAKSAIYGVRKMEVETVLGPPGYGFIEAQTGDELIEQTNLLGGWLDFRRQILANTNKDNVVFESGQLQVRGNERLKAGRQLVITRANARPVTGYITKVTHSFSPFQGFITNLTLERVTNFIERSTAQEPQYLPEVNAKGAM